MIGLEVRGGDAVARGFAGRATAVVPTVRRVVSSNARRLQALVRARASGRPGPRVQTGDYRRSIAVEITGTTATVGTNRPQGPRLELGFVGVDALGRHYNQPPFPHFRPAAAEIEPQFAAELEQAVGQ
jgi:hypothetical protein